MRAKTLAAFPTTVGSSQFALPFDDWRKIAITLIVVNESNRLLTPFCVEHTYNAEAQKPPLGGFV